MKYKDAIADYEPYFFFTFITVAINYTKADTHSRRNTSPWEVDNEHRNDCKIKNGNRKNTVYKRARQNLNQDKYE